MVFYLGNISIVNGTKLSHKMEDGREKIEILKHQDHFPVDKVIK